MITTDSYITGLRASIHDALLAGNMDSYRDLSLIYADALEDADLPIAALRRRRKAITLRPPGVLWPHAALIPGLSPHQAEEVGKALSRPVGILTGTPGTGKTYCAGLILAEVVGTQGSDIAACAPTGKAAVRLTSALLGAGLQLRATTIHQLLEIGRNGHDGEGWGFRRNATNPLRQRFVLVDECFPGNTNVDTASGKKHIRDIRPGDWIINASGIDTVIATKKTEVQRVVKLRIGTRTIYCSENHRWFTARGVVVASKLERGDSLVETAPALRLLRGNDHSPRLTRKRQALLQLLLLGDMVESMPGSPRQMPHAGGPQEARRCEEGVASVRQPESPSRNRENHRTEPYVDARRVRENIREAQECGAPTAHQGRQREGHDQAASGTSGSPRSGLASGVHRKPRQARAGLSDPLQDRPRGANPANRHRSRRSQPQSQEAKGGRRPQDGEAHLSRLDGVAVLEQGHPELDRLRDADGKLRFYDLQAARHPSFSVEGLLTHNCSMLDTGLFACLLAALRPGTHLLLVGDPHQLPPVGHGAPLRDMIAAGVPCGKLSEIRRNDGLIVRACAAIKDGKKFATVAPKDFGPGPDCNLVMVPADNSTEQVEKLVKVLEALPVEVPPQVICGLNGGSAIGRKDLNASLQALINGEPQHGEYMVEDRVICLKNGPYPIVDGDQNQDTAYVANGEMGVCVDVQRGYCLVRFLDPPRLVRVYTSQAGDSEDDGARDAGESATAERQNFALGYAITGHKSQGSEWPVVVVMLDGSRGADRVCSREWLYTAISRASQLCVLIGSQGTIDGMLRRTELAKRRTRLTSLLRESLREKRSEASL